WGELRRLSGIARERRGPPLRSSPLVSFWPPAIVHPVGRRRGNDRSYLDLPLGRVDLRAMSRTDVPYRETSRRSLSSREWWPPQAAVSCVAPGRFWGAVGAPLWCVPQSHCFPTREAVGEFGENATVTKHGFQ